MFKMCNYWSIRSQRFSNRYSKLIRIQKTVMNKQFYGCKKKCTY